MADLYSQSCLAGGKIRIGLVNYEFRNKDISFNLKQIERGIKEASGKADLLCFGEAFLQGFDSLSWNFGIDKTIAVPRDSTIISTICECSRRYGIDLLFGYIEKDGESIFSSCAVIENGRLTHNYRRISRGWKAYWKTDNHYKEGEGILEFSYKGNSITIALCGDIWDYPERFKTDGLLIWPVYVNLKIDEWRQCEEKAYAQQALLVSDRVLMIDSFCRSSEPNGVAGTFFFQNGEIAAKTEYGAESILIIEV